MRKKNPARETGIGNKSEAKARVTETPITDVLEQNFMPYAMSVIVSRALPEIDGLKPAHRKLLFTMYKMGLLGERRIKSADIVGQTMRLNPHGDGPIYETMVRLARGNGALLHPFVDSKGNFGKHYSRDMAYAASRYTEARLDGICAELFEGIDKGVVDMVDNYNATMKEPTLLPTTYPNCLVTPNHGIAVGMASTVCSFNLREVCQTAIAWLQNPDADLMKTLPAPDFSTGCEAVLKPGEMEAIYETGRGSFRLRARYRYDRAQGVIEVYEIPYTTTVEAIIDKTAALVKAGKVKDINDIRDETDLGGLKIAIDIKKDADPDSVMQRLFALTPLMDSFSCNFNFLIDGKPKVLGIKGILGEWARFRADTLKRRYAHDMRRMSEKLHLLDGLSKVLLGIDLAIKIIRETKKEADVAENLMTEFGITRPQAEHVAEMKLRHLNGERLLSMTGEKDALEKELAALAELAGSDEKIKKEIISQLREIAKKYGRPRMTGIAEHVEAPPAAPDETADGCGLRLLLTKGSYFKKIQLAGPRPAGEQYLKEGDGILLELDATNRDELLFFTDMQNVYKARARDLPECKASSLGEYLENLLGMAPGEKAVYMAVGGDFGGHMLFAYENGKVAKARFADYATKTNRKKLVNAYSARSPLVAALRAPGDLELYLQRDGDKALVVSSALLPEAGSKSSGGAAVFSMKKNSKLTKMRPVEEGDCGGNIDYYRIGRLPSSGYFLQKQLEIGG